MATGSTLRRILSTFAIISDADQNLKCCYFRDISIHTYGIQLKNSTTHTKNSPNLAQLFHLTAGVSPESQTKISSKAYKDNIHKSNQKTFPKNDITTTLIKTLRKKKNRYTFHRVNEHCLLLFLNKVCCHEKHLERD